MQTYGNWDIQEIPLRSPFFHNKVERFLAANGLRLEEVDLYITVQDANGSILAGGGLSKDIIKCIAVAPEARSEGLATPLVSRLIAEASARGVHNVKVFTKPEYRAVFESLGFKLLAQAPKAILLENGRGLERYCEYLKGFRRPGKSGVIVMNANPFTLGHKYLIDKASEQVDTLYVIPVREDVSRFSYAERLAMIRSAIANPTHAEASAGASGIGKIIFRDGARKTNFPEAIANPTRAEASVVVLEGSDYAISAATFPTYFLKNLSDAAETQMQLDLDLYSRWIAPALGATVRFVGSEPVDALTAHYNTLIPNAVEIPRLQMAYARPEVCFTSDPIISASKVRKALAEGRYQEAAVMCPETTYPYLLAALAERALRLELDTPLKPGLVCPESNGAHKDMDYALMLKGISAIRPFFPQMAMASSADDLRQLGIDAEKAMMAATGGVNTHRGAIFALGLALNAAGSLIGREMEATDYIELMQNHLCKNAQVILRNSLSDNQFHFTLVGARRMASTGYKELFEDWLPYYRQQRGAEPRHNDSVNREEVSLPGASAKYLAEGRDTSSLQKLLLKIMSTLDDTCIVKRVGQERAEAVKNEAAVVLQEIPGQAGDDGALKDMCERFAREGISPGGAADMLALTVFIDSITKQI